MVGQSSIRFRSLEPEIIKVVEAPSKDYRKCATYIAKKALHYAGIHDHPTVIAAIQLLGTNDLHDSTEKQALIKFAQELGSAELNIEALLDRGKALETEQTRR